MSKMNLPGFNAEASLCKTSERYLQQTGGAMPGNSSIVPADTCCAPCGRDLCCDSCGVGPPERSFRLRLSI